MANPIFVIAATVGRGNRVKQFYSDVPDAPRFLLRDGGELRHAGFDITIGALPQMAADGCWEAIQGERKSIRLYPDGTLIFRCAADDSFLGWTDRPAQFLKHPRLNPVAVVEVQTSFITFYGRIVERLKLQPSEVRFQLEIPYPTVDSGERLFLTESTKGGIITWVDRPFYRVEEAPARAQLTVEAKRVLSDPAGVAYQAVERFYAMFDAPNEIIPFVLEVDGAKTIDIDQIRKL